MHYKNSNTQTNKQNIYEWWIGPTHITSFSPHQSHLSLVLRFKLHFYYPIIILHKWHKNESLYKRKTLMFIFWWASNKVSVLLKSKKKKWFLPFLKQWLGLWLSYLYLKRYNVNINVIIGVVSNLLYTIYKYIHVV